MVIAARSLAETATTRLAGLAAFIQSPNVVAAMRAGPTGGTLAS